MQIKNQIGLLASISAKKPDLTATEHTAWQQHDKAKRTRVVQQHIDNEDGASS